MFIRVHHLSLSWARLIHPHPRTLLRAILISFPPSPASSNHMSSNWFLPFRFPHHNSVCISMSYCPSYMSHSAHFIFHISWGINYADGDGNLYFLAKEMLFVTLLVVLGRLDASRRGVPRSQNHRSGRWRSWNTHIHRSAWTILRTVCFQERDSPGR